MSKQMNNKYNIKEPHSLDEKKLKQAKADFDKLMLQIKPFVKKSKIILTSTKGKWYDTNSNHKTIIPKNSMYH